MGLSELTGVEPTGDMSKDRETVEELESTRYLRVWHDHSEIGGV